MTIDSEIKTKLKNKGYKLENIIIKSFLGYVYLFEIKIDGETVEIYDARKKCFID